MPGEDSGMKTETSQHLDVSLPRGLPFCAKGGCSRCVETISTYLQVLYSLHTLHCKIFSSPAADTGCEGTPSAVDTL